MPQVGALVGVGPGVPVGEEQDALGSRRAEPREEVPQVQPDALAGHVVDGLHLDRVGRGPQVLEDPVPGALVGRRAGNARPELHLSLEVAEGALPGELALPARSALGGAREAEREAERGAPQAALSDGHGDTI